MVEVSAIYDSKTFASMGYILFDNEWCQKESIKNRLDTLKVSKSMSNPMLFVAKKIEELKDRLTTIE